MFSRRFDEFLKSIFKEGGPELMNPPVFHFDVSLTLTMMMGPFVVDTKLLYRAVWT